MNRDGKWNFFHLEKEEEIKECKPAVCSSFSLIYPAPKVACPALFDQIVCLPFHRVEVSSCFSKIL